ncbi:MAG: hypothetical protein DRR00_22415 [Candidatus Parabeggiatoa sp. nov. 3]|nr:MAG: hypothetical protein DRR00_22415 [Gammaproteobacteria bacterium]
MKKKSPWIIRPDVPDEVYTDREDIIERLLKDAYEGIARRTMSMVLLGQRRMGKTEIFKRVVNRLFFEQDHQDPNAVIPVYFSFPEEKIDRWEFSIRYVENFIRWYAAFRLRDPKLISDAVVHRQDLPEFIRTHLKVSKIFDGVLNFLHSLEIKDVTIPEQTALSIPREVSDREESTIAMFLDEFQNTQLPQYEFRVVGFMQTAVESNTCPHFVTGSAIGMLTDILGRGALFGRFMSQPIEGLTDYYGEELAKRAAQYHGATVATEIAPVVSERCGGNPFYITAVVRQAARQNKVLDSESSLNEMLAVDLSSGFIWEELNDQVMRWIARINDYGITKWILYLAALEEEKWIDLSRIQRELKEREGKAVSLEQIKDVLIKLSRSDLLEYNQVGNWFRKMKDPILNEFLKVWGRINATGENAVQVQEETVLKSQKIQKKFADYKGYLAEVYMIQILWNCQRKVLPGDYFHSPVDIKVADRFFYIAHRSKLGIGLGMEVDIYAAAGIEGWVAESKWWDNKKVGPSVVESLFEHAQEINQRKGLEILRIWLFAHDGVTKKAEKLMLQHGILWSNRADLDALLEIAKLRTLPDF